MHLQWLAVWGGTWKPMREKNLKKVWRRGQTQSLNTCQVLTRQRESKLVQRTSPLMWTRQGKKLWNLQTRMVSKNMCHQRIPALLFFLNHHWKSSLKKNLSNTGCFFRKVPPRKILSMELVPLNRIKSLSTLVPPKDCELFEYYCTASL